MSDIEFDCPECGGLLVVSARGAGLMVNCTLCSSPIRIPEPKTNGNVSAFKFDCPHCQQHIEAPDEMLGLVVECPACNKSIKIPNARPQTCLRLKQSSPSTCNNVPPSTSSEKTAKDSQTETNKKSCGGCGLSIAIAVVVVVIFLNLIRSCDDEPSVKQNSNTPVNGALTGDEASRSNRIGIDSKIITSVREQISIARNKNEKMFLESLLTHLNRIKSGGDINVEVDGGTALMAAAGCHPQAARLLIENGADVNAISSRARLTPLLAAASSGFTETAKLLLEKGAKVNFKGKYDMTALIMATAGGHAETVKLLIENGAELAAKETRVGLTALDLATKKGYADCIEVLKNYKTRKPVSSLQMDTPTAPDLNSVPDKTIYSTPNGCGGKYKDPVNGFFEFQPPDGYKITVRRDKSEFYISEGSHKGTTVPSSYIMLVSGSSQIIIISRKTFQSLDEAAPSLMSGLRKRISIERERQVTIDGEEALEVIGNGGGTKLFSVKYKKYDLDNTLTLCCPVASFTTCRNDFINILQTYKAHSTTGNQ